MFLNSDMSVSYTGEGIYSTYDDGTPVSMILDLDHSKRLNQFMMLIMMKDQAQRQ